MPDRPIYRGDWLTKTPRVHNNWKPKVPRDNHPASRNSKMFDLTYAIRSYHMHSETSIRLHFLSWKDFTIIFEGLPMLMNLYEVVCKAEDDLRVKPDKTNKHKANDEENDKREVFTEDDGWDHVLNFRI
ncbi:hypothetical protein Tco_0921689 [Tanacetum coccineum]